MLLVRCKSSKEANQIMAPFLRSSQKRYTTEGETSVIHKLIKSDAIVVIRGLAGEYADAAIAVMTTRGNGRASQYRALALVLSSYLADERPQGVREEEASSFIRHHRTVNRMVEGPGFRQALGRRPWPPMMTIKHHHHQVAIKAEPSTSSAFIESATLISPATSMSESSPSSCTDFSASTTGTRGYDSELEDTASKPGGGIQCCASSSSAMTSCTLIDDFGSSLVFKEMQRLARNDSFNELDTSVIESLDDYTDFEHCF